MKKLKLVWVAVAFLLVGCASSPIKQEFFVQGDHGKLSAVLNVPRGKKEYPLVLILHGFNASKDMPLLTNLSQQLNARGIATLLFDFNGHGKSEGDFLDMTVWNQWQDARNVYAYAEKLPHVRSVSLTGHSMGAVVAALLAGELGVEKIKTVVLMAPAPELTEDTAKGDLFGVRYDPQHVPEYITLPTGLKVGRAFLETTPSVPVYEIPARYTGPVLIIHSQDDQLVPYRYGEKYSQIFPHARLETLHGLDHNFTQDTPGVNHKIADYLEQQLLLGE